MIHYVLGKFYLNSTRKKPLYAECLYYEWSCYEERERTIVFTLQKDSKLAKKTGTGHIWDIKWLIKTFKYKLIYCKLHV